MNTSKRKVLICLVIVTFASLASKTPQAQQKSLYDPFSFRMYAAQDADQLSQANATFSITGAFSFANGDPWTSCKTREEFAQKMKKFQAFTRECKRRGFVIISYVSKTIRRPESEGRLFDIWKNRWSEYEDYFGPRPTVHPQEWLAIRPDGSLWGHTHIPPSQAATFVMPKVPDERAGCDLNPNFRQYIKGLIKIVCETGVDGIYLDHTENKCGYCKFCRDDFIHYLKQNYPADYLERIYQVAGLDDLKMPVRGTDPFHREFLKWRAYTGAQFHRFVRDYARTLNPSFIMSGNGYSADGFHSAIGSADMELLGEVDDVPYSEIAVASNFESGKARVPHMEGAVRISNSPHYKHFRAMAGLDKPILVYPLYPESPNPVPHENALYPVVQLVIAECIAHGMTFRRVEPNHSNYVLLAAFDSYKFLKENESAYFGQRLYSDVAVLSSLNQFYSRRYSYFYCVSRSLTDAGINHRIITERLLTLESLKAFKVLILPYVPLMSTAQVEVISQYVREGGSVLVLGDSSSHDEFGQKRDKLALAGMLGFEGSSRPTSAQRSEVGAGRVVFIPLPEGLMSEGDIDYKASHAWFSRGEFPADMATILKSVPEQVNWASRGRAVPMLRNADRMEATLMRHISGKKYLAHLVNYQMTIDGDITPGSNVLLTVPLEDGERVASVRLLLPLQNSQEIPFIFRSAPRSPRSTVSVVVPEVKVYAAVEVNLM